MAEQYYAINLSRASLAEICRFAPSTRARLAVIAKKLVGKNEILKGLLLFNGDTARFWLPNLRPKGIDSTVEQHIEECVRSGLELECLLSIGNLFRRVDHGVLLVHRHRQFWGHLAWRWSYADGQLEGSVLFTCTSELADGRLLTTASFKRALDPPPDFEVEYLPGAGVVDIVAQHSRRLQELDAAQVRRLCNVATSAREAVDRKVEYHTAKGIFIPLNMQWLRTIDESPCTVDHGFPGEPVSPDVFYRDTVGRA